MKIVLTRGYSFFMVLTVMITTLLFVGCNSSNTSDQPVAETEIEKAMEIVEENEEQDQMVRSAEELTERLESARPGDVIIIANGEMVDEVLTIDVSGTKDNPITVKAETPGKVILTGSSRLRIGGDYIVVDGLYFKDGSLEGDMGGVIEFRGDMGDAAANPVANHSTLRNTVVAYYNNEDRMMDYKWISIYGTYNTVEYCEVIGKNHSGTAMVVWRDDDSANYHTIQYNKFMYIEDDEDGNGAEALRVGTSAKSLSDSFTTVAYNYFEQCNGEIEIISNKSGNNTYKGNVFVNNAGLLTLRHGNSCIVEGNYFFGGGYPESGGIRVIGEDHKIINNYIENTNGGGSVFRSAISLTNGVVDSPLNRYFQVKNAYVANNILVNNTANIFIGSGADEELSLAPLDSTIENNIVLSAEGSKALVYEYAEPINMTYSNNIMYGAPLNLEVSDEEVKIEEPKFTVENGLYVPDESYGVAMPEPPISVDEVGASWVDSVDKSVDLSFRERNLYEEFYNKEVTVIWSDLPGVMVLGIDSQDAYVGKIRYKTDFLDPTVTPIVEDGVAMAPKAFIEKHLGEAGTTSNEDYITVDEIRDIYNMNVLYDERGFILIVEEEDIFDLLSLKITTTKIADLYKVLGSTNDGNIPVNTIDGLLTTRWSADGDGQWLRYSLYEEKEVSAIEIAFYKGDKRTNDFEIQVSTDSLEWTSVFEGTSSGTTINPERYEFEPVMAKYVKVVGHMSSTTSWNSVTEVQFFNTEDEALIDYIKLKPDVVVEKVVDEYVPVQLEGTPIGTTDDAYVEIGDPDNTFGKTDADKLRVKANIDSSIVRISYLKFDVSEVEDFESVMFQISGKVSTNNPANPVFEFDVYGITEDDWSEDTITWNNSPNHAMDSTEVLGLDETAFHLGSFEMSGPGITKRHVVDVTEFVKAQKDADGIVTLMIVDSKIQNGNTDPYSKERSDEAARPYLYFN